MYKSVKKSGGMQSPPLLLQTDGCVFDVFKSSLIYSHRKSEWGFTSLSFRFIKHKPSMVIRFLRNYQVSQVIEFVSRRHSFCECQFVCITCVGLKPNSNQTLRWGQQNMCCCRSFVNHPLPYPTPVSVTLRTCNFFSTSQQMSSLFPFLVFYFQHSSIHPSGQVQLFLRRSFETRRRPQDMVKRKGEIQEMFIAQKLKRKFGDEMRRHLFFAPNDKLF